MRLPGHSSACSSANAYACVCAHARTAPSACPHPRAHVTIPETLNSKPVPKRTPILCAGADYRYTNPTGQVFNPANNALTDPVVMPIFQQTRINLYPFTAVLPNGLVMVISGALTRFYRCVP